jgi:dihydrofolate synthase/folylpolyglutamate synthase
MGGGWDATNLVAGDVAVLCPIGLDHPELGSTVTEVATEKAGIIKAGKVVVSREQDDAALTVIRHRCDETGADLKLELEDFEVVERLHAVGGQTCRIRGLYAEYEDLFVPLFGEHAVRNAAGAIASVEAILGHGLDERSVRDAMSDARSPGRLEIVGRHPQIVLDGAHNPAGAEALSAAMREFFVWDRLHLVLAVSSNKDLDGLVAPIAPLADAVYAARNTSGRSFDAATIADRFGAGGTSVDEFDTVGAALDAARAAAATDDLILVTGSLYTVADARRALGVVG